MCGYVDQGPPVPDTLIVSLGTGEPQPRPLSYRRTRRWGVIGWGLRLIDVIFAGVTETTEYELRQILAADHERYQVELSVAEEAIDDARPSNVTALVGLARELIAKRSAELDALCARLLARKGLPAP